MRNRAAAVIIGNEILTGKIKDLNTHFLGQYCFQRGVTLERVVTIPDDIPDIASTVASLSAQLGPSGVVFTSGK